MNTKLITLSDYRKNLSRYTKEAREQNLLYIVMVHGKPVLEVKAASEDLYLESPAYRNETWDSFDSPEALLTDLQQYHNVAK
ncbi:MAG: hypothetical protein PHU93_04495 [Candidatus Gracilibacteria bacterium]|nr:hypothetical protein [Candidatus Gracilibacteria bacterium]